MSDDAWGWVFWIVVLSAMWYFGGDNPPEEREDYKSGYEFSYADGYADGHADGHAEGYNDGKEEICDEIEYRLNYGAASAVGC